MGSSLADWGWTPALAAAVDAGVDVARVVAEHRGHYDLATGDGRLDAVAVAPALRRAAATSDDYPAVGDWVTLGDGDGTDPVIGERLPRRSAIVRRAAGPVPEPQTLAANVDTVFVVTSVSDEFNVRRIERYLAMVLADDIVPVVVLTKVDRGADPAALLDELDGVTGGRVATVVVSNITGLGHDRLADWLVPRSTTALVGSSGVGKSSLVNRATGRDGQHVAEVRDDDRGRHTTIRRELIALPNGALVIDTPGIREVRLWRREGLEAAFPEIAAHVGRCQFGDCSHRGDPGCAVCAAVEDGSVQAARVDDFLALADELDETEGALQRRRR